MTRPRPSDRSAPDNADGADAELSRTFHEAQRAADTIFSHYQLSQLLATHELPGPMAEAVLDELVHVSGAAGGAIWIERRPGAGPELVTTRQTTAAEAEAPARPDDGWVRIDLEDVGRVALAPEPGRAIDSSARRFLDLVRHELAIALRGAVLRELLERERAELASVIQGASDAIVLVDADRRVTRANPAAARLLERDATALVGRPCHQALRCEVDGKGRPCGGHCPFDLVLAGGDPIDAAERQVGGTASVVGSYAVTSNDVDGRPRAVGILRDTSELARLAELRSGFLGSVSHELRTPLALVKGYVETLLDLDPDRATARTILERIDAATDRLGAMVSQIIDASQVAAGHLELDLRSVRPGSIVREATRDLSVRMPGLGVRLELDDEAEVTGDPERLRQVIDNLLANAAKYGDATSGIDVRMRTVAGRVELRVEDRGIGIPLEERELVFEQFHRGRNVRERSVPGSGLGLSIARRIIEAHGGTIAFDADREEGAAIVVSLPMARPATTAIPIASTEVPA